MKSRAKPKPAVKQVIVSEEEEDELAPSPPPRLASRSKSLSTTPAPQLREPQSAAERSIAHLPPPRKRSGVPQPGEKPKMASKRKLGGRRTAAEKKKRVISVDDDGWEAGYDPRSHMTSHCL